MAHDLLAPRFIVDIGGELETGITQFIESVEYESADGMADMARLVIQNPTLDLQDLKIFQPGNEMSIWLGYGTKELEHIGRVILRRTTWSFPRDGTPKINVSGYTFDAKMMDNSPEESKRRRFVDMTYADIVAEVAADYGFATLDIDDTEDEPGKRAQVAGVSDYQVIKGAANITGYFFWVDGDEDGKWTIHFKSPANVLDAVDQPDFLFSYNNGDLTTLFSFNPELLIQGTKTKLKVQFRDPKTQKTITEEVEEDLEAPDIQAVGEASDANEDEIENATSIKIFFQDFSFETETKKKFKTAGEAKRWAAQWFRRQREAFILGNGETIGVESLRARQIHTLDGIGDTLVGKWYFSRVKHILNAGSGYECKFDARKQSGVE